MKHRIWGVAAGLAAGLVAGAASATTGYLQHAGANLSGSTSRSLGLGVLTANPAAPQYVLRDDQNWRVGYLYLPNIGYEFGPVDNFVDDIERFEDELERLEDDPNTTQQEAQDFVDEFNGVLSRIGDAAYVNIDVQQQVPALPAVFRAWGGTVTLDAAVELRAQVRILDAPLRIEDSTSGGACTGASVDCDVETDSAGYIQTGQFTRLSAGYSRQIPLDAKAISWVPWPADATFTAGARVNLIQGKLARAIALLDDDDGGNNNDEDSFDRLEDNYEDNEETSIGFGVDVGMLIGLGDFYAGATIYNLIPPSFDFGDIGVNCGQFADAGRQNDCNVAAGFEGDIALSADHSEDFRLNVEGGYNFPGTAWEVAGSLDLNKTESVVGDDFQWLTLSGSYDPESWWVPGLVLGYKANLAGSELSYATFGLNLFSFLGINLSYGLESATIDGSSSPRSAAIAIGFERPL